MKKIMLNNIACVTGGTGMVGSKIVDLLLAHKYAVRVLTRKPNYIKRKVEIIQGGLENEDVLNKFLYNASLLFHCAGELNNESKMWEVNVKGTERLIRLIAKSSIRYFCYISSAGVVGKTNLTLVDEETPCAPMNLYEKSKLAAEQLVSRGINKCRVVILRPTNVIDGGRPGALMLPLRGSWLDYLKVFLKGGECAHIIHAEDVASAAMYFVSRPFEGVQCFIVSRDHEPMNTFAELWLLYKSIEINRDYRRFVPHLPLIVPYGLRILLGKGSNRGDVRYSSQKIISKGFSFPLGIKGAVRSIVFNFKNGRR